MWVTGFGGNVLATRQVRRSDFTAANQWQNFTLQFDNLCFGLFEARVWWNGNTNLKFAQLTITPLDVASKLELFDELIGSLKVDPSF